MTRPGSLAAAEQLYALGRYRECLSLANAGLRESGAPVPALLDVKARALDALGDAAAAEAARAEREAAVAALRETREAERRTEADSREAAFEAALRAVGARRKGEPPAPPEPTASDRSGWAVVAAKIGMSGIPFAAKLLSLGAKAGLAAAAVGGWAIFFGWEFAALLVLMVAVHESGHVAAMRLCRIPTSGFYLLPFVGGVAISKRRPDSHRVWAFIVLAGPAVGSLLSIPALVLWHQTGELWWAGIALVNGLLNLLNLLPIYPLDGGQLVKILAGATSPKGAVAFAVATGVLSGAALFYGFWLFGLLGLMSVWGLFREARLRRRVAEQEPGFEAWELTPSDLTPRARAVTAVAYLGLAAALIALVVWLETATGLTGVRDFL